VPVCEGGVVPPSPPFRPSTAHAQLGPLFYDAVEPARFPQQILRHRDQRWAERVGLGTLTGEEWLDHFALFEPLPGSLPQPLALRYHGHQFRTYNPDLGDGRGFLFAQVHDLADGRLLDLATKGSGRTPWSRGGDGRLTLKGGVREVLATEMLEALRVNTSKSLSLVETGEALARGDEPSPTRSAVLVRLSHSHIRIGTFQRLAYLGETEALGRLLDYTIETYMPELWRDAVADRAAAFLGEVCRRVAAVGAAWMAAGFVHGVLNSDNINVTGESFDYGPWRFLPVLDPAFTAAYFDHAGIYAYGRQPDALLWNLIRLAECLLPLGERQALEDALGAFEAAFHVEQPAALLARLGVASRGAEEDMALALAWWGWMGESGVPFERAFFDWHGGPAAAGRAEAGPEGARYRAPDFATVRRLLDEYAPAPGARLDHPYWQRAAPATMLIEDVEALWAPIAARDDWSLFHAKLADIGELREALAAPVGMASER
jgi:uncharacterized protein YdiU (UPF0061 family)